MWLANTVPRRMMSPCSKSLTFARSNTPPLRHCSFSWSERGLRTDHELSAAHLYPWHLTSKCDLATFMPRKSMLFSSVHPCRKRGMDCSEWHVSNVEQSKAEIDLHSSWRLADKKMTKATVTLNDSESLNTTALSLQCLHLSFSLSPAALSILWHMLYLLHLNLLKKERFSGRIVLI